MAASLHVYCTALLLAASDGVRFSRKRASGSTSPHTKLIAGVPVLNYHTAYGGKGSFAELERAEEQEWVVMMTADTTDAKVQAMCETSKNGCNLVGHPKGGVPFLEFRGTEQDLEAVLRTGDGVVKYVEPDQAVAAVPEMEADMQAATWGLTRVGVETRSHTGAGVTIFVMDTGVRVSHEDFTGRVIPAIDVSTLTLVECKGDLACAPDWNGHGSHCAGTAAGQTYGVAPAATIRSMKVLTDQGGGQWSMSYQALDWLAVSTDRPAVASMSLGGRGYQQAIIDAIDGAVNSGVTVVVAAGNENIDACEFAPAFVPSAIAVGSMDKWDIKSSFSNHGSCVEIWGPGSDVLSAGQLWDSQITSKSGTSMACPHVSGGAALLLEADPSLKPAQVLQALIWKAEKDVLLGLKAEDTNALLHVGDTGPAPPSPAPVPTPGPSPGPSPTTAPPSPRPPTTCPADISNGPDSSGDCTCFRGLVCYEDGLRGCTYSLTERFGFTSDQWFSVSCAACHCE